MDFKNRNLWKIKFPDEEGTYKKRQITTVSPCQTNLQMVTVYFPTSRDPDQTSVKSDFRSLTFRWRFRLRPVLPLRNIGNSDGRVAGTASLSAIRAGLSEAKQAFWIWENSVTTYDLANYIRKALYAAYTFTLPKQPP